MERHVDVAIIGGGPAGLAAALAAKEQAPTRSVLIIERDRALGGILQQCIHNGFGLHYFREELTGPEYAARFVERLADADIEVMTDTMVLEFSRERRLLAVSAAQGVVQLTAGAIVLAMGCRERTRGALNIPGSRPAGVYTAGCAQRLVNMEGMMPGKRAVILGSGDIGLIMARRMAWEGAQVELVAELMPHSSGLNRNIVQCLVDNDIPLKFNHTVTKIHGSERVEAVTVAEVDGETRQVIAGSEQVYPCDTLLLSVGLIPENELTRQAGIRIDPVTAGAMVDERRQTSVPGVFACGNVLHVHDLVDNVSDEAALAGRAAMRFASEAPPAAQPAERAVRVRGGVRYAVPQRLSPAATGKTDLFFRVGAVYRNAFVKVSADGRTLYKRRRQIMVPGEMEKITVDLTDVRGDIIIEIVEEAV